MARLPTPDAVPVLSPGKHRTPRRGACFMEFASFLAGERWSDNPKCTHPLLAGLARGVNDLTSDAGRPRLVPLIPSVIGLTSDDPAVDAGIALRSATIALPVVSEPRQRALAAGLLAARRFLANHGSEGVPGMDTKDLFDDAQRALLRTPHAATWAEERIGDDQLTPKALRHRSAPSVVRFSVVGIAEACIPDPDAVLYELLETAINDCSHWLRAKPALSPEQVTAR